MTTYATPDWTAHPRVGAGFKAVHFDAITKDRPAIDFFEVHAENYMGAGGAPHRMLELLCERYALSVHGVGLSIGDGAGLDNAHLARLKAVVDRYQPQLVSEHLAWSTHSSAFYNDLLPIPYRYDVLDTVVEHVEKVQECLGRRILIENPSTYFAYGEPDMPEVEFIREMQRRTGCGLILDVNNVFISANNQQTSAADYLSEFPIEAVGEIHLAGHADDVDDAGKKLLIDAHDRPVADPVWQLYDQLLQRTGPLPTLIEWDNEVPDWATLFAEAVRARNLISAHTMADNTRTQDHVA